MSNELIDLNHNSETEFKISDQEDIISNEDVNTSLETNNENENSENENENSENESINAVFDNDEQKEQYIILNLREWSSSRILSMSKINELLAWLHLVFPNLRKSYKTLLGTPNNINIINFRNGEQF